ncbi:MAG: exostosin family protein, partial [Cyanobacteria bacterium P01_G01_bin.54]
MKIASVPFPKTNYLKTNKDLIRIHRWINYSPWDQVFFDDADIIIIPYVFSKGSASPFVVRESMEAFIYLFFSPAETKKRFIVLDNDDSDSPYDFLKSHFVFKTSANYRHKEIFPLPYNAIIPRYPIPSIEESEFDLSFQGSLITHPIRKQLEIWRRTWKMLKIDFIANDKPYWSYSRQEQCQLQQSYIEQIYKSKFVLCPRGRALNSRRFFETLAYGRIPIL